jgi:hypothetical protein
MHGVVLGVIAAPLVHTDMSSSHALTEPCTQVCWWLCKYWKVVSGEVFLTGVGSSQLAARGPALADASAAVNSQYRHVSALPCR